MAVLGRNNGLLSFQHRGTDQRHDQANGQYLEVREQNNDHRVLVHLRIRPSLLPAYRSKPGWLPGPQFSIS